MSLLLNYQPLLSEAEYESGPVPIHAVATLSVDGVVLTQGAIPITAHAIVIVDGYAHAYGALGILGGANLIAFGHATSFGSVDINGQATIAADGWSSRVGVVSILVTANMNVTPLWVELSIHGLATFKIDLSQIQPVVTVINPKSADIKSYILRRHHEVVVSSKPAHIEIESRKPEIKVIDID